MTVFPDLPEDKSDLTAFLNVKKYEPVRMLHEQNGQSNQPSDIAGNFPANVPKTDAERIQNLMAYFSFYREEPFEITEKLDGTSMSSVCQPGRVFVCSRNWELHETENGRYWRIARKIIPALTGMSNIVLQGELVGEKYKRIH